LCVKEKDVANKKTLDKEADLEVCIGELKLEFWKRYRYKHERIA
jgi:hypothetical protein